MFGRRSSTAPTDAGPAETPEESVPAAQQPKGRPTPSRKDAEAHRKQNLKVPADPKAARKAMKQREREARMEARAGLMAGDERYLPARDQGPAKAYVRNYIDRKRRLSEYFIFIAVAILLVAFVRNPQVQNLVSLVWFLIAGIVLLEVGWVLFRLNRDLTERWPDKAERKGCLLYAALRMLQIRRLRIPPPKVKPGGAPVDR
ncbi:MAG: DUF3043 domain-containing protein [Candidatus Nanopelagicales bacterium]